MSQACEGTRTFVAGEALAAFRRVKLTAANTVSYADADESCIGVTIEAAASAASVSVRLMGGQTCKVVASAAVTAAAAVYGVADGKVDDAGAGSDSVAIGMAVAAALANGDVIEIAFY